MLRGKLKSSGNLQKLRLTSKEFTANSVFFISRHPSRYLSLFMKDIAWCFRIETLPPVRENNVKYTHCGSHSVQPQKGEDINDGQSEYI